MTLNMRYTFNKLRFVFLSIIIIAVSCGKDDQNKNTPNPPETLNKKKIILLIGDGMGLSQITAASVANGGSLNLERCKHIGMQKVYASDKLVPSSASTTTSLACGVKTKYLSVGVDDQGNAVPNLTEILSAEDYSTGIVTTSFLADATPVCFYAHNTDRYAREEMATELAGSGLDVIIGGGRDHFNIRADSLNLLDSMAAHNFLVFDELQSAMDIQQGKVACFTDKMNPPKISEGRGDMLSQGTELALRLLDLNDKGFFLMAEGAQVDWACHEYDTEYMIEEMLDFDKTVGQVLDYADRDKNTLVVILGDHETGGFGLTGGNEASGAVIGRFLTSNHTATMIPVFAYGPGAEEFTGVYKNTEIFDKFLNFYGIQNKRNYN